MTDKELLYIEDALGHLKHIKTLCENCSNKLQDPNLKSFVVKVYNKSQDLETKFLEILNEAKSNLPEHGTGKDIYEKWVKPSIVTAKQLTCLWAISSLYDDFEDEEEVYCYTIKKNAYKKPGYQVWKSYKTIPDNPGF